MRRVRPVFRITLVLAALMIRPPAPARGAEESPGTGDWPGLWGPARNARVAAPAVPGAAWQAREVWRRPLGKGYSEIAVVKDRGYTMLSDGEIDFLIGLDIATGKEVWRTRMAATHRGHDGSDDGPISTPFVSGGRIFALDPFGRLFAFDAATGKELWQRDLKADFAAVAPWYGFATSPLVIQEKLVVQAGGEKQNNLVALDPATGKTLWSSHPASQNGYSSPVAATLAGAAQVVAATTDKIFGVDPRTGTVLWSHAALGESRQSPMLLPDDRIFVNVWNESAVLKVTADAGAFKVEEVWRKPVFKSNYSPAVYHDGHLYGMNGIFLTCLDAASGELKWREKVYNGSLILVGDHLALLGERSGNFHLIAASPEGFREKLRVPVFNPGAKSVTGPVFAAGRFFLRNTEELVALEVGPAAAGAAKEGR
jgi:outer membrane protein assembly factor BamB